MGLRGPLKGSGGRPRNTTPKSKTTAGYPQTTVGPKSNGTRAYVHRVVSAGGTVGGSKVPPKSSVRATKGIVDHKDGNRANYNKSNLRITTASGNNKNRRKT